MEEQKVDHTLMFEQQPEKQIPEALKFRLDKIKKTRTKEDIEMKLAKAELYRVQSRKVMAKTDQENSDDGQRRFWPHSNWINERENALIEKQEASKAKRFSAFEKHTQSIQRVRDRSQEHNIRVAEMRTKVVEEKLAQKNKISMKLAIKLDEAQQRRDNHL